jgi:hypothetical protein
MCHAIRVDQFTFHCPHPVSPRPTSPRTTFKWVLPPRPVQEFPSTGEAVMAGTLSMAVHIIPASAPFQRLLRVITTTKLHPPPPPQRSQDSEGLSLGGAPGPDTECAATDPKWSDAITTLVCSRSQHRHSRVRAIPHTIASHRARLILHSASPHIPPSLNSPRNSSTYPPARRSFSSSTLFP